MSTTNSLSVFPPPRIPRISVPNPHFRKPSLKTVKTVKPTDSVVITLEEIRSPDIAEGNGHDGRAQSLANSTERSTSSASTANQGSPDPSTISSTATLVQSSQDDGHVAIKSMFPVYNPSVSFDRQSYHPHRSIPAYDPRQMAMGSTQVNAHNNLAVSARHSQANTMAVVTAKQPTFSSLKDLEKLWDATSQSQSTMTHGSFDLQMARPEDAVFTFGPSSDTPFYTFTTYDTQEIGVTKTCPRKQTLICDVALSKVEDASRRDDPSDGLVSFIFPKMAAMMAMNQSSALAEDYSLSPTDLDEIQDAAVKRAASQEASRLCWNAAENRYELDHPAVTRKHRQPDFVSSPLSPQGLNKPSLHITVTTSEQHKEDQPIILVTFPGSAQIKSPTDGEVSSPSNAGPVSDVHLASLDLNNHTLHIEANSILKIMPSLFAIDSIFSAIVTVAIADPHANRAIGKIKVSPLNPANPAQALRSDATQSCTSPNSGAFYATIAEREGAEEESKARAKTRKKSLKDKTKSATFVEPFDKEVDVEAGRSWYGKSKEKKEKKRTKQIVIAEFDLDTLTHYQAGSRQGQKLPTITVGALTMTVNTLRFVVWIQTMFVKFLCWLMVGVTRGVTSEKF